MSLMVGSARIDENGKISGGKPGDQGELFSETDGRKCRVS